MYTTKNVIAALDRYCADNGETLEQREARLEAAAAPIRTTLENAGELAINRNIKLVLLQLEITPDAFLPYLEQ